MIQTTKDFSKSGISTDAAVHLLVGDNRPSNPAYEADE
jgi:hypothetical protein